MGDIVALKGCFRVGEGAFWVLKLVRRKAGEETVVGCLVTLDYGGFPKETRQGSDKNFNWYALLEDYLQTVLKGHVLDCAV